MMSLIIWTVRLLVLFFGHGRCCNVDGKTWRPSSGIPVMLHRHQHRPGPLSPYITTHPTIAFLRGGGSDADTYQSRSSIPTVFSGGSTAQRPSTASDSEASLSSTTAIISDDDSTLTVSSQPSSSTVNPDEPILSTTTTTSSSFLHRIIPDNGGDIVTDSNELQSQGSNTKNDTETSTPLSTRAAIKLRRKREKEQRKRYKQIAKQLRNRNAVNKRRKFMHAAWGLLFASLNHFIPRIVFVPSMTVVTTGSLVLELLRYRKGFEWMNEGLHKILGHALRKNEMDGRFTGSFYYFLGVTVTSALYPTSCATLGICQLAIADPTASFFGRATRHVYWSRIGNGLGGLGRNKGFLGFLGGALCCLPLNYRLLSLAKYTDPTAVGRSTIFLASLALGVAGAFADLIVPTPALTLPKKVYGVRVPPFHVDDNFIVPVVSGWACVQIFRLCNWPSNLELASHLIVR